MTEPTYMGMLERIAVAMERMATAQEESDRRSQEMHEAMMQTAQDRRRSEERFEEIYKMRKAEHDEMMGAALIERAFEGPEDEAYGETP